jgi:hypothetical protein
MVLPWIIRDPPRSPVEPGSGQMGSTQTNTTAQIGTPRRKLAGNQGGLFAVTIVWTDTASAIGTLLRGKRKSILQAHATSAIGSILS